jgi:hypothetical protein
MSGVDVTFPKMGRNSTPPQRGHLHSNRIMGGIAVITTIQSTKTTTREISGSLASPTAPATMTTPHKS